ncbi:hypothetical protein PFISCL1PPCAC_10851, partial [Pristionchus fissidentatus]
VKRNVVITGANRGIGLGLVKELLKEEKVGRIFATTRNAAKSVEEISDDRVIIVEMDAESDESIEKAVQMIGKTVGSSGVDILVNNAGVLNHVSVSEKINRKKALDNFNVNCVCSMAVTQCFHDLLKAGAKKHKHSQIVNVSSLLGSIALSTGSMEANVTPYSMSKAGLNLFTKNISIDWKGDGIRATSVHPGWVKTDLGGDMAPLTVEQSTSSMARTILKLGEAHNGLFFDWNGKAMDW